MPTNWSVITAANLKVGKASAVVDALASAALAVGQADPTAEVITNASQRIRSEIASSGRFSLSGTTNAIPPSLKSLAVRLILWDLQSRLNTLGGTMEPNDQEKTDHRDDLRYLERIARGEVTIEIPDDPDDTIDAQAGVAIDIVGELVEDRPFQCSRSTMSAL